MKYLFISLFAFFSISNLVYAQKPNDFEFIEKSKLFISKAFNNENINNLDKGVTKFFLKSKTYEKFKKLGGVNSSLNFIGSKEYIIKNFIINHNESHLLEVFFEKNKQTQKWKALSWYIRKDGKVINKSEELPASSDTENFAEFLKKINTLQLPIDSQNLGLSKEGKYIIDYVSVYQNKKLMTTVTLEFDFIPFDITPNSTGWSLSNVKIIHPEDEPQSDSTPQGRIVTIIPNWKEELKKKSQNQNIDTQDNTSSEEDVTQEKKYEIYEIDCDYKSEPLKQDWVRIAFRLTSPIEEPMLRNLMDRIIRATEEGKDKKRLIISIFDTFTIKKDFNNKCNFLKKEKQYKDKLIFDLGNPIRDIKYGKVEQGVYIDVSF